MRGFIAAAVAVIVVSGVCAACSLEVKYPSSQQSLPNDSQGSSDIQLELSPDLLEEVGPDVAEIEEITAVACTTQEDCEAALGDPTACHVWVCLPESGTCSRHEVQDTLPCDDGDPCSLDDRCSSGLCVGTQNSCSDSDPCTNDFCDNADGSCHHTPISGCTPGCVDKGNTYDPAGDHPECCVDLSPVPDCGLKSPMDCVVGSVGCTPVCECNPMRRCIQCGDGQCLVGENECNCPDDCWEGIALDCAVMGGNCIPKSAEDWNFGCSADKSPLSVQGCLEGVCCVPNHPATCVAMGVVVSGQASEVNCCVGSAIDRFIEQSGGSCIPDEGRVVCADCGNGVCDAGAENNCNCAADCPPLTGTCATDADCPEGSFCLQNTCVSCTQEVCGDGLDNNCDGSIDESGCLDCVTPGGYAETTVEILLTGDSFVEGDLVAIKGDSQPGPASCIPIPLCVDDACCQACEAPLVVKSTSGGHVQLATGTLGGIPLCTGTNCTFSSQCSPIPSGLHVRVWGKLVFDLIGPVSAPRIRLHGWCLTP